MEKNFNKIINELCIEKKIENKEISYGWIKELKQNGKVIHIIGNKLDINSINSTIIAKDKFATYDVMVSNNIPVIEHKIIFNPETRSTCYKNKFIDDAKKILKEYGKVVIKANDSCQGKDVYCCETNTEIDNIIKKLFEEKNDSLSACPYVDIEYEYRAIYLCGEVIYVYKKEKPYVIGNGVNTLKELIEKKEVKNNIKINILKNIDLEYIPKSGEKVTISWKHNLSNGAEPILIDENDQYIDEVKRVAIAAGKAMNINFASIDISLTKDKKILIMEVNCNVCMNKFSEIIPNGYEIAKEVYSKALDKMFEK